ncbi:MAG: helix-turn-helix domain-containing protein [Mycobacteriales bacterium]
MRQVDPSLRPQLRVSPEQLKLMSFGPRREIIAALANDADLSARDLAERTRRPVTGLYRHLSLLLKSGLIRECGQRPGPKRPEALYALTFATFSAIEATATNEGRAALAEAAARYAGATTRKLKSAIQTGAARLTGADANAGYGNMDLQLDRAGLAEFHRLMGEFIVAARKLRVRRAADAETVSVVILFAPTL